MKRILSLVCVAALLLVTVLTGCGNNNDSTAPSDNSSDKSAELSGEVLYWGQDYCQKCLASCLDEFKAKYPGITINTETVANGDILNKLILALSAGEGAPDVATVPTYYMSQLVNTGCLYDITEYMKPYQDSVVQSSLANSVLDGKVYGVPLDVGPCGIYYNTTIFEKAGYDTSVEAMSETLSTWEKYAAVAEDIKEKTGCYMFAESTDLSDAELFQMMMWQQNTWYENANGDLTLNSPESVKALTLLKDMVDKELNYNVQSWTQEWYNGYNERKVATIPTAVWMGGFMADSVCPDTAGEWRVVPFPAWEEGGIRTSNNGGSSWLMTNLTQNPEASWAVMEFFALNEQNVVTQYKAMDQFPAYVPSYSNTFFDEGVEFFGGQQVRRMFADLADQIPEDVVYTKDYAICQKTMQSALQSIYLNDTPIEAALETAESEIESQR